MLPTEVHMLRETSGSEKLVLISLLSTIPFGVVFMNSFEYLTLFRGLSEKRAAIIVIVFIGVEKLNTKLGVTGTDVVQCSSQ